MHLSRINKRSFKAKRRNAIVKCSFDRTVLANHKPFNDAIIHGRVDCIPSTEFGWEHLDEHEAKSCYVSLPRALRNNNELDSSVLSMLSQECSTSCILPEAIRSGLPGDVLMLLAKRFPIFLTQVDENERYPVHVACAFGASLESVCHCINSTPMSANARDIEGKTPIHLLCQGVWQGCWDSKSSSAAGENMKDIMWMLYLNAPSSFVSNDNHRVGCIEYDIESDLGIAVFLTLQEMVGRYERGEARKVVQSKCTAASHQLQRETHSVNASEAWC